MQLVEDMMCLSCEVIDAKWKYVQSLKINIFNVATARANLITTRTRRKIVKDSFFHTLVQANDEKSFKFLNNFDVIELSHFLSKVSDSLWLLL